MDGPARLQEEPMKSADSIGGYTYAAESWCPEHLIDRLVFDGVLSPGAWDMTAEEALHQHAEANGITRMDEWTFDSDDFPKVIFHSEVDDATTCAKTGDPIGECQ
jgi:hypothetical protein